jgi:hypothetical protein
MSSDADVTCYENVRAPPDFGSVHLHPSTPDLFVTDTVFDWDDTLFPTTFMGLMGLSVDSLPSALQPFQPILTALDELVELLLLRTLEVSPVTIITNGSAGWVQLSAKRFLPRTFVVLMQYVKVVSARGEHERAFPGTTEACMVAWKLCAFRNHYDTSVPHKNIDRPWYNFVSIGDSTIERDAFHVITAGKDGMHSKSVKLITQPTTEQLRLQLEMLTFHIQAIIAHEGSLDQVVAIHTEVGCSTAVVELRPAECCDANGGVGSLDDFAEADVVDVAEVAYPVDAPSSLSGECTPMSPDAHSVAWAAPWSLDAATDNHGHEPDKSTEPSPNIEVMCNPQAAPDQRATTDVHKRCAHAMLISV